MISQTYYLIRTKRDGQYLVARPQVEGAENPSNNGFLLIFKEQFDALSYLNTHGSGVASQFAVESVSGIHLEPLLKRWGFQGVGIVEDPLLPRIEFMLRQRGFNL